MPAFWSLGLCEQKSLPPDLIDPSGFCDGTRTLRQVQGVSSITGCMADQSSPTILAQWPLNGGHRQPGETCRRRMIPGECYCL
jgi:hypothetical protein